MTKLKSYWTSLVGGGLSSLPLLTTVCGVGCAGACGAAAAAPVASILGVSTVATSTWLTQWTPLLIALSTVFFTIGFINLYRQRNDNCQDEQCKPKSANIAVRKAFFWVMVIMTVSFYAYQSMGGDKDTVKSCSVKSTSCSASGGSQE